MGVLLVGVAAELAAALMARLVGADDEVRVIEPDARLIERWRGAGAHVAPGSPDDADLIERAARGTRSMVVGESSCAAALEALAATAVSEREGRRIIIVAHSRSGPAEADVAEFDHVILRVKKGRWRKAAPPDQIARAVEAADDLAGELRLDLDLSSADAWERLGLEPGSG